MPLNLKAIRDLKLEPVEQRFGKAQTILYALGVGAGLGPDDLNLVYEPHLKALPTMAVVLAPEAFWMADPRFGVTFTQVLHGEQKLELHTALPAEGTVIGQASIEGVYDKGGKGAVLVIKRELRDQGGTLIATVRASVFARADGGFGGTSEGQPAPHPTPEREPDQTVTLPTRPDQALIYRLSGDLNPLHIDPNSARQAGFDRPILHGLCGYGVAARAIIGALCGGDPERLTRLDVRFASPVYPGETLVVEIWIEGPGRAAFRVRVEERNLVAISNGRADYRPPTPV